jgi:hypothetical protein
MRSFKRLMKGFDPKLADELQAELAAACSSATAARRTTGR